MSFSNSYIFLMNIVQCFAIWCIRRMEMSIVMLSVVYKQFKEGNVSILNLEDWRNIYITCNI